MNELCDENELKWQKHFIPDRSMDVIVIINASYFCDSAEL